MLWWTGCDSSDRKLWQFVFIYWGADTISSISTARTILDWSKCVPSGTKVFHLFAIHWALDPQFCSGRLLILCVVQGWSLEPQLWLILTGYGKVVELIVRQLLAGASGKDSGALKGPLDAQPRIGGACCFCLPLAYLDYVLKLICAITFVYI